jgi:hypothetical protein
MYLSAATPGDGGLLDHPKDVERLSHMVASEDMSMKSIAFLMLSQLTPLL